MVNTITVYLVFITLGIFVVFLIIVILYLLSSLLIRNYESKKIEDEKQRIFYLLNNIMKTNSINNEAEIIELKNVFLDRIKVQAFYLAYIEYIQKNGYSEKLRILLNETVDYKKIVKSKVVRKEYRSSYVLFLMSEFRSSSKDVGEYALKNLNNKSIYVRNNAINVIKHFNQTDMVIEALEIINKNEYYFNNKILVDFLDNFKGEMSKLDNELLKVFDGCKDSVKKIIVDHFKNIESDQIEVKEKMISIISNSIENGEIIISATRYFSSIIYEKAKPYILKNMDSKMWTLRAVSSTVISNYRGEDVIKKLKDKLSDENYFVRYNSALSFVNMEKKEIVIKETFENEDRFARDTLLYAINERGILSIDEYKNILNRKELKV